MSKQIFLEDGQGQTLHGSSSAQAGVIGRTSADISASKPCSRPFLWQMGVKHDLDEGVLSGMLKS